MKLENNDTSSLPECLIIPVGAKSVKAIENYVGPIWKRGPADRWIEVEFAPLAPPNKLPVWQ